METIGILTIIIFDYSNITAIAAVWSQFFDARVQTRVLIHVFGMNLMFFRV